MVGWVEWFVQHADFGVVTVIAVVGILAVGALCCVRGRKMACSVCRYSEAR